MRRRLPASSAVPNLSRRSLLTGVVAGGALVVGWMAWPRAANPSLTAAPGEAVLNGFVKVGADGHVTVVSPQIELGQGSATLVAQIIADELGADWRTIAVEPAPVNALYDNVLLSADWRSGWFNRASLQATGGSTTVREFEPRVRQAAAAARTVLTMAAAKRWDADWRACATEEGFVVLGKNRLRFGELAEEAATFDLPNHIPLRLGGTRLKGRGVNRLDVPAKLDGSANFAADVRLPDMLFASIRQGPPGDSRLVSFDRKAASRVQGVVSVIDHQRWIAVAANSWWAANVALDAMKPKFVTQGGLARQRDVDRALAAALKQDGKVVAKEGDADGLLAGARPLVRDYSAGFGPHAALEPMTATAAIDGDRMQLWVATQAPGLARKAAARATGFAEEAITVHAMQVGGSFGRKYEIDAAAQVALIARTLGRPVQLVWSRAQDMTQDRMRPAAQARMEARLDVAGQIEALRIKVATADSMAELVSRSHGGLTPHEARFAALDSFSATAVDGAVPPYAIANYAVSHHAADVAIPTGKLRGGAHGLTAFFVESFIDELAAQSGRDPFSFRMAMLSGNVRLAKCLAKVTARGGWEGGGQGTSQGLACHSMQGSHIAVLAEATMGDNGRARVSRLVAVADVGQVINPDIARQQIEGGLLFGMGLATGAPVGLDKGLPTPRQLGLLALPKLADMPEVSVELIRSSEAPGGIGELAVPPVAPAIANAIFAGSGQRFRSLPIRQVAT